MILGGLTTLLGGIGLGIWLSRRSLRTRIEEVQEQERLVKHSKMEVQRMQYESSTSRIHRDGGQLDPDIAHLRDQMEQKSLELSILEQESALEQRMLREENDQLQKQLSNIKGDPVLFTEIPPAKGPASNSDERDTPSEVFEIVEILPEPPEATQVPTPESVPSPIKTVNKESSKSPGSDASKVNEITEISEAKEIKETRESAKITKVPEVLEVEEVAEEIDETENSEDIEITKLSEVTGTVNFGIPDFLRSYSDEEVEEIAGSVDDSRDAQTGEDHDPKDPNLVSSDKPAESDAPHVPVAFSEDPLSEEGDLDVGLTKTDATPEPKPVIPDSESDDAFDMLTSLSELPKSDHMAEISPDPEYNKDEILDDFHFHWTPAPSPATPSEGEESSVPKPNPMASLPPFQNLSELVINTTEQELKSPTRSSVVAITNLSEEQFLLLEDLGYADPNKMANLSKSEIRRLSEIFRINPQVIKTEWIPGARAL
ncbi:MAG TPA: hypothetical protein DCY57_04285 [Bacteroidetes bacterium]|nr:hypothetical protein [Bacteroidota bacterium]